MRRLLILALFLVACGGHNSPTAPDVAALGRLSGTVTIGPNCPVEQINNPCPTSPEAYAARKVLVYDAAHSTILHTVDMAPLPDDLPTDAPLPLPIAPGAAVFANGRHIKPQPRWEVLSRLTKHWQVAVARTRRAG